MGYRQVLDTQQACDGGLLCHRSRPAREHPHGKVWLVTTARTAASGAPSPRPRSAPATSWSPPPAARTPGLSWSPPTPTRSGRRLDVTDHTAVRPGGRGVAERHGRIDVWSATRAHVGSGRGRLDDAERRSLFDDARLPGAPPPSPRPCCPICGPAAPGDRAGQQHGRADLAAGLPAPAARPSLALEASNHRHRVRPLGIDVLVSSSPAPSAQPPRQGRRQRGRHRGLRGHRRRRPGLRRTGGGTEEGDPARPPPPSSPPGRRETPLQLALGSSSIDAITPTWTRCAPTSWPARRRSAGTPRVDG